MSAQRHLVDDTTTLAIRKATSGAAESEAIAQPVHVQVRNNAERLWDAEAVSSHDEAITYGDLMRRATSIAGLLDDLGPLDGMAVAVKLQPGPRQVAVLLGVLQTGAHLVCLDPAGAGDRDRIVLEEMRPALLVADSACANDRLVEWYQNQLRGRVVDPATSFTAIGSKAIRGPLDGRAYVAYTSGSSGTPKGIPQTHESLAQFVTWFAREFGFAPGTKVAQWASPAYDASLCEIFATLTSGATLCPVPERSRADPVKLVEWIDHERITVLQTVPSFANELLKAVNERCGSLASLDHLLLAGESLSPELATRLRAALPFARLINLYGPTESILATWHEIAEPPRGVVPIGQPIPGRQILLLDDSDHPCPPETDGNIVIRSPYLPPGYINGKEGNAAFRPVAGLADLGAEPTRCYRTGDLGRIRPDGLFEFRGRKDLQLKFHGTRIEITELEAALTTHDSIADCAFVAVTDECGVISRLVAYVVKRAQSFDGGDPVRDWRKHLNRWFGALRLPVSFEIVTNMPRNTGGKIDRNGLARITNSKFSPHS